MLKIIEEVVKGETVIMSEMKPLEVGVITDERSEFSRYKGHIVMRTAKVDDFEVMDLSEQEEDSCWDNPEADLEVTLLAKGEKITVELSND